MRPSLLVSLLLAISLALVGCGAKPKRAASVLNEPDRAVFAQYTAIRLALVEEDLRRSRSAGVGLTKALETSGVSPALLKTKAGAKTLSETNRLDLARTAFKDVSASILGHFGDVEGYFIVESSMVLDGRWVQDTKEIGNPFLGRALANSGEIK